MSGNLLVLEILLRGLALGTLCATAAGFVRSGASRAVRVGGALFCASIVAYAINSSAAIRPVIGAAQPLFQVLSVGSAYRRLGADSGSLRSIA